MIECRRRTLRVSIAEEDSQSFQILVVAGVWAPSRHRLAYCKESSLRTKARKVGK